MAAGNERPMKLIRVDLNCFIALCTDALATDMAGPVTKEFNTRNTMSGLVV